MGVPFEGSETLVRIYSRGVPRAIPFVECESVVLGKLITRKRFQMKRTYAYLIYVPSGPYAHISFQFLPPSVTPLMTLIQKGNEIVDMDSVDTVATFNGECDMFVLYFKTANYPPHDYTLRIRSYGCCYLDQEILVTVSP